MSEEAPTNQFFNKKNIVWVLLSVAMAITITTVLFLPLDLGAGLTSVYSLMLWYGLVGLTLFRYTDNNGWIGFISGSVIGLLIHIFAPALATVSI